MGSSLTYSNLIYGKDCCQLDGWTGGSGRIRREEKAFPYCGLTRSAPLCHRLPMRPRVSGASKLDRGGMSSKLQRVDGAVGFGTDAEAGGEKFGENFETGDEARAGARGGGSGVEMAEIGGADGRGRLP